MRKSSVEEIRERFDNDVERFSNFESGQSATVDAPLALSLVAEAAARTTPGAKHLVDIGCGAGNYTLSVLRQLPNLDVTLIDLSSNMLRRAQDRVGAATNGTVVTRQADIRELELGEGDADLVVAAAVLHHLRADEEWRDTFAKIYRSLRPGGSFWVFDLLDHDATPVREMMKRRYGDYLTGLKDEAYRDHVFDYIEKEDTPKPLVFQLDLLREVGFVHRDVLHKNACFAAFGAVKA
ncbi:hypothetical protein Pan216_19130 [Planctomycetes bacterium Pan216]|uniref:Methyltransferase domain-containing protein n=1 Tax=Kolteria novifilia TaxID=2527975 RepID=A0A518B244_9BACT|nr:hypothetical protein Pan216_19130 [Planctomycetes bacterium Pan216]